MRRRLIGWDTMRNRFASTVGLLFAASCSGSDPSGSGLPKEFEILVPEHAVALIHLRSLTELAEELDKFDELTLEPGQLAGQLLDLLDLHSDAKRYLDLTQGMGLAIRFHPQAVPPIQGVALLPTRQPEKLAELLRENFNPLESRAEGRYLAVYLDGAAPKSSGRSRLLDAWPASLCNARLNVSAIAPTLIPFLAMGSGVINGLLMQNLESEADTQLLSDIVSSFMRFLNEAVSSTDLCDIRFESKEGEIALDLLAHLIPGSSLAMKAQPSEVDYPSLLAELDPDAALGMVWIPQSTLIFEGYGDVFQRVMAAAEADPNVAPEVAAALRSYISSGRELLEHTGRSFQFSFSFDQNSILSYWSMAAEDPAKLMDGVVAMLHDETLAPLGISATPPTSRVVNGFPASTWEQRLDYLALARITNDGAAFDAMPSLEPFMTSLMGSERAHPMTVARDEKEVHLLYGADMARHDSLLRRQAQAGRPSRDLARLGELVGGADPGGIFFLDGRSALRLFLEHAPPPTRAVDPAHLKQVLDAFGEDPMLFVMYWGHRPTDLRAGLRFDLQRATRMIEFIATR